MGSAQEEKRMEGWLYVIQSNRFGLHHSRRNYFVLEGNALDCFRSAPASTDEAPIKIALIDSHVRVEDNGRESIHDNVFFIFTLYNTANRGHQLKLGARSSEEAAKWIRSLMKVALNLNGFQNHEEKVVGCSRRLWLPFRFSHRRTRSHTTSLDWTTFLSMNTDPMTSDVVAPSPWTIFGCSNGLRLFKETNDGYSLGKLWDEHPAIMAVGVIDAYTEAIFQTIMSLGPSRSEWDFCFYHGRVVEHIDGHNDIVHKQLKSDWLPWGTIRRDLLLRRYWRREDDGTYVILYHSVIDKRCPPERGCIRACIKSGGYVISPVNDGRQSVVRHMLSVDWKFWQSYLFSSSAKYITMKMLGRIAALREYFKAKMGNWQICDLPSGESTRETRTNNCKSKKSTEEAQYKGESTGGGRRDNELPNAASKDFTVGRSFLELNDACDEFFDVPEESERDPLEAIWPSDAYLYTQEQCPNKLTPTSSFVKKLHDLAVQKRIHSDVREAGESTSWIYGNTLPKDPTCNSLCSWAMTDPSTFLVRGSTYLQDRLKIKANGTLLQMVAADWLKSDKREDDLAGRPNSIVQKYASKGRKEFFFIVNIQVPGSTTYSLALYFMMEVPLESVPLLESFVKGDDAFRNSRFKLIPYISKGSWIVKQSVGKKACLVGQALEINYFCGKNYIELGVDIGSSTVARGVVSLVLGYLNNLVIEMAFLVQANTEDELPEFLLGTCRLNHLDAAKAIPVKPC